jgi:hypothetical protein
MPFVLIGNSARIALPVLQAVRSFGDEMCVLAGSRETAALRWSSLCERHVLIDFDDDDSSVRRINGLAEKAPGALLIPFDCEGIRLVNRVGSRLALASIPVPDLPTLDMFDDKWRFYQFCLANTLPAPATRWIGSKQNLDFSVLEGRLGLPFVVKPTNCSGSLGVQIVRSRRMFEQEILHNPLYQHEPLIAQRYIDGMDMDINLLSVHGRLCASSIHRVEGSWMDFLRHPALQEIAEKLCRASGYHGVMNVDVRLDKGTGEVFLVESNPRFWASLVAAVGCGLWAELRRGKRQALSPGRRPAPAHVRQIPHPASPVAARRVAAAMFRQRRGRAPAARQVVRSVFPGPTRAGNAGDGLEVAGSRQGAAAAARYALNGTTVCRCSPSPWIPRVITSPFFR